MKLFTLLLTIICILGFALNNANARLGGAPTAPWEKQVAPPYDQGEETIGQTTYNSNGYTMRTRGDGTGRGYLANPSRSSQINARNAGALTNREARSMGLNNYRGGRITNDEMEETVGQNCIFCTQNNK